MGKIRKPRKNKIIEQQPTDKNALCEQNDQPSQQQNVDANNVVATEVEPAKQQEQKVALAKANNVIADQDDTQQNSVVEEISTTKKRIWEVDFLRGFMMLFVIWDHFMWDIRYAVGGDYKTRLFQWLYQLSANYYSGEADSLRVITHDTFVSMFVLLSGVSCSFSQNNGKRAIKMVCFSLLFSAITYAAGMTVNFNVIHVVTLSVLIWTALEWLLKKLNKDWQKNIFGWVMFAIIITVLIVGYQSRAVPWTNESKIWFFLAEHSLTVDGFAKYWGSDYLAFFPDFGWFLLGVFLGQKLYKQKTTLFPTFNEKWVSPITFVGRYSIWVYFGSQVLMIGFIFLLHKIFPIL